jgi:hypothetical protein
MDPQQYRRARQERRTTSYTQIYDDLDRLWGQEHFELTVFASIMYLFLAFYFLDEINPLRSGDYTLGIILFFVIIIAQVYLYLLLFLTRSQSREPALEVPFVATWIMVGIPRPFSDLRGLGQAHIRHLMEIARIHQSASGWRGSYMDVIVGGAIALAVALSPLAWRSVLQAAVEPQAATPSIWSGLWAWMQQTPYVELTVGVYVVFMFLLTLWVSRKLFVGLHRFFATEPTNRVILMACEDALAFLEARGLTGEADLAFSDKEAIAAQFGCRIIEAAKATYTIKQEGLWSNEPSGVEWYLMPPARLSTPTKALLLTRIVWNKLFRKNHPSEDEEDI